MFTRICVLLTALLVIVVPALAQTALQSGPPGPSAATASGSRFAERFEAANTTHDGNLTLAQAQAAHMPAITSHFSQIDGSNKGYVTLADVRAFRNEINAGT